MLGHKPRSETLVLLLFALFGLSLLSLNSPVVSYGHCGDCMNKICYPGTFCADVADSATNGPWTGTEVSGASAYDVSFIAGQSNGYASGTVTYHLYTDGTCGSSDEVMSMNGNMWPVMVTLDSLGNVPPSLDTGPLSVGSYSFLADYSGGGGYAGGMDCETFTVSPISTAVFDASAVAAGTTASATATVMTDTAAAYTANALTGDMLTYTSGPASGESQVIVSNTATTITTAAFASAPTATGGDSYSVTAPWSGTEVTGSLSSASAYDTAVVVEPGTTPSPTGTVTYHLYADGTCGSAAEVTMLNGITWPQQVNLNLDGSVPNSQATGTLVAGRYSFQAVYSSGDSNYADGDSCQPFNVQGLNTAVFDASTNAVWSGTEVTGSTAYDTSTVTGFNAFFSEEYVTPHGSVTYNLFTNGGCTGAPASSQTVTISGGSVPDSAPTSGLAPGSYSFQSTFSGTGDYAGISYTSFCEPFSVQKGTAEISTSVSPSNSPALGVDVSDVAIATGASGFAPTGTVTITLYPGGLCAGTAIATYTAVPLNTAQSVPNQDAGTYSFIATAYSGDSNYVSGTSGTCEPFTIPQDAPTVSSSATTPLSLGAGSATDLATLTGAYSPTGTVTFTLYGPSASPSCVPGDLVGSTASSSWSGSNGGSWSATGTLSHTFTSAGTYYWVVSFGGDTDNIATGPSACGASGEALTVNKGTATISTTVNPSTTPAVGAAISDSVSATGLGVTPTGTVTIALYSGNTCSGGAIDTYPGVSLGSSSPTVSPVLVPGTYSFLSASYSGDSNYLSGASGPCESFTVQYKNCPQVPNTGGANLAGANLEYCYLPGHKLSGDNLKGANLEYTDLQNANFAGANLQSALLAGAYAPGANFQGANLAFAGLSNSVLTNAKFNGANLVGANLSHVSAVGASFQACNLQGANLSYGDFNSANFTGANTSSTKITGASFVGAVNPP
jgi:hypothetical protein